jgi:ribosomal protein S18 acetylase RimI-like enzyme
MTGVGAAEVLRPAPGGLRRFDPTRDLRDVIGLLHLGFGADLDPRDRRWLEEMESLARAGPLLGWLMRLAPASDNVFGGYVWAEDGRVVANASLMRVTRGVWVIANVVTDPDYRRRGLARRLVVAAIADARARGGRQVQLQVRADNQPARTLYRELGFRHLTAVTAYRLESLGQGMVPAAPPVGTRLVTWGRDAGQRVPAMLVRSGEIEGQPPGPVRQALSRRGWDGALSDWLHGLRRLTLAAEAEAAYVAVAAATVQTLGGGHALEVITDPRWRGQVEVALVERLLAALASHTAGEVTADVREDETGARAALEASGFTPVRTLERMTLPL